MNDYLQRLVRPAAVAARAVPPALQEIDVVVPAPTVAPVSAQSDPAENAAAALEEVTRGVSAPALQPPASAAHSAAAGDGPSPPREAAPQNATAMAAALPHDERHARRPAHPASAAPAQMSESFRPASPTMGTASALPPHAAASAPIAPIAKTEQRQRARPAPRPAMADRQPVRDAAGDVVEVHVGSISLTVRAPVPAPVATPAPAAAAAQRPAASAREGMRFSAGRHHLRWN